MTPPQSNDTVDESTSTARIPYKQIRASYDDATITVYQAYNAEIAAAAVAAQRLDASSQFRHTRMTWIKPSWAWMLYRAGYSYKDPGQERILALTMRREHFIGLLRRGVLTSHAQRTPEIGETQPRHEVRQADTSKADSGRDSVTPGSSGQRRQRKQCKTDHSPAASREVKIQWDPERTVRLGRLDYRSIQIGIPPGLSEQWTHEWIQRIDDVTDKARRLKRVLDERPEVTDMELRAMGVVPDERPFEISADLQQALGMTLSE
ncbi:hypothetical protein VTK73DRAFT_446 [Phialemonium thermophilum]|uniref:ATP-dependent RNA helicase DHX8 n=1 Tax=Phialemonium thermophilum TaxID=223376 RepID=A0ABR3XFF0_9PEZI